MLTSNPTQSGPWWFNIYTSSVFCYYEHKKNFDIHSSMVPLPWRMAGCSKYCKCGGFFRSRKISRNCWQNISRGGNFHNTTPISFMKAYGFYFRVGVMLCIKNGYFWLWVIYPWLQPVYSNYFFALQSFWLWVSSCEGVVKHRSRDSDPFRPFCHCFDVKISPTTPPLQRRLEKSYYDVMRYMTFSREIKLTLCKTCSFSTILQWNFIFSLFTWLGTTIF